MRTFDRLFAYLFSLPLAFAGMGILFYLAFLAADPVYLFDVALFAIRVAGAAMVVLLGLHLCFGVELQPAFTNRIRPLPPSWKREDKSETSTTFALRVFLCLWRDAFFLLGFSAFIGLCVIVVWEGHYGVAPEVFTYPLEDVFSVTVLLVALAFGIPGLFRFDWWNKPGKFGAVALLLFCLNCQGCAHKGLGGSYVGDLPTGAAVQSIASDAAGQVSALYPPGHTSLLLLTPKKDAGNSFSVAFEDFLRRQGFTVTTTADSNTVAVAYVLDTLPGDEKGEEPAWYLQLRLSDNEEGGTAFARSYTASGRPEAGRSRTNITFTRSTAVRLTDSAVAKAGKTYDSTMEYLTE